MNATNNPYAVTPPTDTTLTQEGVAADSKAVGDAITTRYIAYIGNTGKTGTITYDMRGKKAGLYMVCFHRSNRMFLLFLNDENMLEPTEPSDYMSITGSKVTFQKLGWYDNGYLLKLA